MYLAIEKPSEIESILESVGFSTTISRKLAVKLASVNKAQRIAQAIDLGRRNGIFKRKNIKKPLGYMHDMIMRSDADPDSGIPQWYLDYEYTGVLAADKVDAHKKITEAKQKHIALYKFCARIDDFESQPELIKRKYLDLAKQCSDDPTSKIKVKSRTSLHVIASQLWARQNRKSNDQ